MHNDYMIVISALFVAMFAIMLYSMIKHRKQCGDRPGFRGPTGKVQWLWALVPLAILAFINLALIDFSTERIVTRPARTELASAHPPRPLAPVSAQKTPMSNAEHREQRLQ